MEADRSLVDDRHEEGEQLDGNKPADSQREIDAGVSILEAASEISQNAVDMRATATLVITDTVHFKTTATLVPEVPCCSHCQEQFPLDQWIAASRCPITEIHGAGQCHAMFLHRHCVQLHYAKYHPQQKCPDEYKHLEQKRNQREE